MHENKIGPKGFAEPKLAYSNRGHWAHIQTREEKLSRARWEWGKEEIETRTHVHLHERAITYYDRATLVPKIKNYAISKNWIFMNLDLKHLISIELWASLSFHQRLFSLNL